jgi:seryl-tRNA synthetase
MLRRLSRSFSLSYKELAANQDRMRRNIADRGIGNLDVGEIVELYNRQKTLVQTLATLKTQQRMEERARNIDECKRLKAEQQKISEHLDAIEPALTKLALRLPNDTHPATPRGDHPRIIKEATGGFLSTLHFLFFLCICYQ